MSWDQPGLRRRLDRETTGIATQHRLLRELLDEIARCLESSSREACQTALARLRRALRAHFTLEEDVIFPALRGLDHDLADALAGLDRDHRRLWQELDDFEGVLDVAGGDEAIRSFEAFRGGLRAHEKIEEGLFERVF